MGRPIMMSLTGVSHPRRLAWIRPLRTMLIMIMSRRRRRSNGGEAKCRAPFDDEAGAKLAC